VTDPTNDLPAGTSVPGTGAEPADAATSAGESADVPEPGPAPDASTPARAAPRIPADALSQRNTIARAKGLPGVVIQGGQDPDPERTRERERPYIRLLVIMVVVIVLAGFVLGFVGLLVGGPP
jgi:hypothetical protein